MPRLSAERQGLRVLDRWLRQEWAAQIQPAYAALARRCRDAWKREHTVPAIERTFTDGIGTVQATLDALIVRSVQLAMRCAELAFARTVQQRYGTATARRVLTAASDSLTNLLLDLLPAWPESIADIPLGKGAPQHVLDTFQHHKDRWGMNYSERIWRNDAQTRAALHQALLTHLATGHSVLRDAKALMTFQVDDPTLPRHLQQLERLARQALRDDPAAKGAFLDEMERVKDRLRERKAGALGTRGFANTLVRQMTRAVEEGIETGVDSAIEAYVAQRGAYRAGVLLRTEGVRAYQLSSWELYKEHEFVQGVKWNLSGNHPAPDECDLKARANVGLGPGVYYKNRIPWPDHVAGICHLSPVLVEPEDLGTAQAVEPEDDAAYAQVIADLQGPLAREANRLGRRADQTGVPQELTRLINRVPQIPRRVIPPQAPPAPLPPPIPPVAAGEQALIREARQNGFALVRDTDQIEDQAVLFWQETGADDQLYTRAMLKVRGAARDTIMEAIRPLSDSPIRWVEREGQFDAAFIQNGRSKLTGQTSFTWQQYYEAEVDGVRLRYWADNDSTSFALRNRLEVRLMGDSAEVSGTILDALRKAGVNIEVPTALDAEELYLRQIAYHRRTGFADFQDAAARYTVQSERVQAMKDALSRSMGVPDVTALPDYNPDGVRQAFGHGWRQLLRPDMIGDEWEQFFRGTRLVHENTNAGSMVDVLDRILNSGGQMISTTDKLRRGIPPGGMSPSADLGSGGANYFFTRLRTSQTRAPGFYWKSTHLKRLDSISYAGDYYGRTSDNYPLTKGLTALENYRYDRQQSSNETIFKNGLSLFDDLDKIVFRSAYERDQAIALFQRHGIQRWPDGRALTTVLKSYAR